MQVGASVRVPRRCGGIFGTRELVLKTLPCPTHMASDFVFSSNLAPGKTPVVSWVGPRTRSVRRRLMSLSPNRQVALLQLGTRLCKDGDLRILAWHNEKAVSPVGPRLAWNGRS